MKNLFALGLALSMTLSLSAKAEIEELDPFSPDIEEKVQELDEFFEASSMPRLEKMMVTPPADCFQFSCKVYIDIQKSLQTATLYVDGQMVNEWKVSTGKNEVDKKGNLIKKRETPNFDRHPDGRVYDKYSSSKYPGGDYNGLGNMPYAVFIKGGFALHGTPKGNWSKLGTKASHGCIRQHPDNAKIFNRLVREHGVRNTWVTVRN